VAENVFKNQAGLREAVEDKPGIIAIPIPGTGYGLRLALKLRLDTTDVAPWGTMDLSRGRS
jgi:hypothetical protein